MGHKRVLKESEDKDKSHETLASMKK